jgi:hypothetical protein
MPPESLVRISRQERDAVLANAASSTLTVLHG